jgi:hypothetical protein
LDDGSDANAPGGAITKALCRHWGHPPPCPLAPHHTAATAVDGRVELRILFAAKAEDEQRVRTLITQALAGGRIIGPDGRESTWSLLSAAPSPVRPDEAEHADRLREN